jgi:hypothetical protein
MMKGMQWGALSSMIFGGVDVSAVRGRELVVAGDLGCEGSWVGG